MISVNDLCKRRGIAKYDVKVPLLIPSFSSKGFPNPQEIWERIYAFLPEAALISSYDIHHEHISSSLINSPNLLFVDSGGYESRYDFDFAEVYNAPYHPKAWSLDRCCEILDCRLNTFSNLVLISFDAPTMNLSIEEQVKRAQEFFSKYPQAATDFLIKPSSTTFLDIDTIIANIDLLQDFDIIGVTEKELGDTIEERLSNIVKLRTALLGNGLETPIHVFGCLDPVNVWLFFICGADIFDGLAWLRFAFFKDVAIYRNEWAVLQGYTDIGVNDLETLSWINNLRYLGQLKLQMSKFLQEYDMLHIPIESGVLAQITDAIGLKFGNGR